MFFFVVVTVFGSALSSFFGQFKDAQVSKIVLDSLNKEFDVVTNTLKPYFENRVMDVGIALDLVKFVKLPSVPEEFKPLLFQSFDYLSQYARHKGDKVMIEDLLRYFNARNDKVYADLLQTAEYLIEKDYDIAFLFRIIGLFERLYIDNRPGYDEFSLFLLRKLKNMPLSDVTQLNNSYAVTIVKQVQMDYTTVTLKDIENRKWFFSHLATTHFPQVKDYILQVCRNLVDTNPLIAETLLLHVGSKLTKNEQRPFILAMIKANKVTLRGAALAKRLGWIDEYKTMLNLRLADNSQPAPLLEATLKVLENAPLTRNRAALDLWRISMDKVIYEGKEQSFDELKEEYYSTLKEFKVQYSDVIRLHIDYLANEKSEKFASVIRMYLKNDWPLEALEPLFGPITANLDLYGAHALYTLAKEFPNVVGLKFKYLVAVSMLSQSRDMVESLKLKLRDFLKARNAVNIPFGQVLLHVIMLANNENAGNLRSMDWEAISDRFKTFSS